MGTGTAAGVTEPAKGDDQRAAFRPAPLRGEVRAGQAAGRPGQGTFVVVGPAQQGMRCGPQGSARGWRGGLGKGGEGLAGGFGEGGGELAEGLGRFGGTVRGLGQQAVGEQADEDGAVGAPKPIRALALAMAS
ncbi:hypothetical protein PL81_40300 [Streptomyces sp. RSD-27]|nr:hypothetical protein PL81_40300 [Streptomyces sp. RSD-27]